MPSTKPSRLQPEPCLSPSELLETLRLRPGECVAEIGLGPYCEEMARAVGPEGRVFPVEPAHDPRIPQACCDRLVIANLWGYLDDPLAMLGEAARLLREDGRLVIIERHESQPGGTSFRELIQALEHNCWDIHRHGDAGGLCYFIEASVTDESVQS